MQSETIIVLSIIFEVHILKETIENWTSDLNHSFKADSPTTWASGERRQSALLPVSRKSKVKSNESLKV